MKLDAILNPSRRSSGTGKIRPATEIMQQARREYADVDGYALLAQEDELAARLQFQKRTGVPSFRQDGDQLKMLRAEIARRREDPLEWGPVEHEWRRKNAIWSYFPDTGPLRRELYEKHMEFFAAGRVYRRRLACCGNKIGKAQPNDEPVLTPDGWRPMGELRVGSLVVGSDGRPTEVTNTFPQGIRPILKIAFSDGSSTRCDQGHLWKVRPVADGKQSGYIVMTAAELRERIEKGERWMLPPRRSVECFAARNLPIDPYLLGLLIGDGGLSGRSVKLSSVDECIIDYCKAIAVQYACSFRRVGTTPTHVFATSAKKAGFGGPQNPLAHKLRTLGLMGLVSKLKRVPAEYLFADSASRLALLRGLMDTDGTCQTNGARSYSSVSIGLCEDVAHLARSLGLNAIVGVKHGTYNGEPHLSWQTRIWRSELSTFNLPRKKEREIFTGYRTTGLVVEAITDAGEAEATCITVAAPDQCYITKDFVITHNSTTMGGYETALHVTGRYPDWWPGKRFDHPVLAWIGNKTGKDCRDINEQILLGPTGDKTNRGTGLLPAHLILDTTQKLGVPNGTEFMYVRHVSGGTSTIQSKSFDAGRTAFQGAPQVHVIWHDEECPKPIAEESAMRTMTCGGILMFTYTPIMGMTDLTIEMFEQAGIDIGELAAEAELAMDDDEDIRTPIDDDTMEHQFGRIPSR